MNERIKELAAQCRTITDYGMGKFETFDDEKFAELIVRECLEVIEKQFGGGKDDGIEWDCAVEYTYNDVKKNFGVE